MVYRLLIFDLDNTIFDYDRAENFALDKTFEQFGLQTSDEIKLSYREINEQNWKLFEKGEISSEKLRVKRFEDFGEAHGFRWNALDVSSAYLKNLGLGGFIIDGADELLLRLKADFMLAGLTNGISDVQRSRLANSPFEGIFNPIIISDEVGVAKPDPAIFALLLEKAGVSNKTEVLMIGDSLSSDIAGAIASGVPSCWYNPAGGEQPVNIKPDFIINSLSEVFEIVYREE
ncbi:MAG: YjjG family noncanonical pyrimidine nucleotidase [Spirochaetales bacterium]|uniref:YjjG family noncanonical pyrimidine nucleotidase n=1 Tax=Candidatus Thalassospirochaeta sargassi TaxID=3119039 RepID=A0AAJ1MP93_9SPIO|nr:YjjG family noncanonical pyrimidine nucleotidase [Spirochaetales bacterium]